MKVITKYITKGQFIKDIISEIPSNILLFKNITGIGATTLEILAKRHSIIIEPYSPVMINKKRKHPDTFIVKHGIGRADIIKYLKNDKIRFKKIVSTPESFSKIMDAFRILKINVYQEYFLLFDECETTCRDVSFRPKIVLPMNDFFKFDKKAFVSATAVIPRDPRFKEQGFEIVNILPDFDISHDITRYKTNNSIYTTMDLLEKDESGNRHFIFANSINAITTLIERLKIHQLSAIFCGENSKIKLKCDSYAHVGLEIEESKFSKYNFFTSRYFRAVDIELKEDVNIYIISDPNISANTLLSPDTDVTQIIGRFREMSFNKNIHVISTTNEKTPYMTDQHIDVYLRVIKGVYYTVKKVLYTISRENDKAKVVIEDLKNILQYNNILEQDGSENTYMIDNIYYDNRVKSLYICPYKLDNAYKTSVLFNSDIKRYNVKNNITRSHDKGSDMIYIYGEQRPYAEIMDEIVDELMKAEDPTDSSELKDLKFLKLKYQSQFPELIEAYELVGGAKLLEECHSKKGVQRLIIKYKKTEGTGNFEFVKDLKSIFYIGKFDTESNLKKSFKALILKHKIEDLSDSSQSLRRFIQKSGQTRKNGIRGYYVTGHNI